MAGFFNPTDGGGKRGPLSSIPLKNCGDHPCYRTASKGGILILFSYYLIYQNSLPKTENQCRTRVRGNKYYATRWCSLWTIFKNVMLPEYIRKYSRIEILIISTHCSFRSWTSFYITFKSNLRKLTFTYQIYYNSTMSYIGESQLLNENI